MDLSSLKIEISSAPATDFFDTSWQSWFDISSYVKNLDYHRGRSRLLDNFTAGTCNITLDNRTRQFEPNNPDSEFYPNIQIRRGIRIYTDNGTTMVPLFAGYIDGWDYSYDSDGNSITIIRAFDMLGRIAAADLGTLKFGRQLSGSRVAGVLQAPGLELDLNTSAWYANDYAAANPTDLRFQTDISAGTFYTREGKASSNALSDIYRCALVENAEFFAKASGALSYRKLDWDTTTVDIYNKYEWNFCRNTRGTIDTLYYSKGTRDASILSTTGIKSVIGHKATGDPDVPIVIYDDEDAPGIDICRKVFLGFWITATSATSGGDFTAHLELYNELGITKSFEQTFDVASSSAWTELMFDILDVTPGATGIRFWVTNDANNVTNFWITRVGFYHPVSNLDFWDGSTTDTATENFGWDTGTRKANIKKSRATNGVITFKANNAYDDIYYVYLYADKSSSTHDIKDSLETVTPTSFTVENGSTTSFTGGYAKVIPYGTSFRSTKTTRDINYATAYYADEDGLGLPYTNIELSYGTEEFYNQVKVTTDGDTYWQKDTISDHVFTKTGNVTITKNNQDSIKTYGVFSFNIPDALTQDKQESLELANRILDSHTNPEYRVESVTVRAETLDDYSFGMEIWDLAQVTFTPNQIGGVITADMYVIGVDVDIQPEYADITLRLATKSPIAPPPTLYPITWIDQAGTYGSVSIARDAGSYYTISINDDGGTPYPVYVQKWTSADTLVWQKSLGTISTQVGSYSQFIVTETDASGNLFIASHKFTGAQLLKITPAGAIAWQKTFTVDAIIKNIAVDDSGNCYVTFVNGVTSSNNKLVVNKFSSSGSLLWSKETTIAGKFLRSATAVSPLGQYVYVSTDVSTYGAIHCYNSSGTLLWAKKFTQSGYSFGFETSIDAADETGVWFYAGASSATSAVFKLDTNGDIVYDYSLPSTMQNGLKVDAQDNIYLGGYGVFGSGTFLTLCKWNKNGIEQFLFEVDRVYGAPLTNNQRNAWSTAFDVTKTGQPRVVGATKYADKTTNSYFPFGIKAPPSPIFYDASNEYRWYFNGTEGFTLATGIGDLTAGTPFTFVDYSPGNATSSVSITNGSASISTSTLTVHSSNQSPTITPL